MREHHINKRITKYTQEVKYEIIEYCYVGHAISAGTQ